MPQNRITGFEAKLLHNSLGSNLTILRQKVARIAHEVLPAAFIDF